MMDLQRSPENQNHSAAVHMSRAFDVSVRYPVLFTRDVFGKNSNHLNEVLFSVAGYEKKGRGTENGPAGFKNPIKIFFVIDDGLLQHWPNLPGQIDHRVSLLKGVFQRVGDFYTVPGGETCKNREDLFDSLMQKIMECGLDRHSIIAAVGGGAVLDLVGFAASISHRGIRHIRFPSTVLSQNDSGVGVKNGINRYGQKNYLGTFSPPQAVINDYNFLETLSNRDLKSGVSEAIKVSLIRDPEFFAWMEKNYARLNDSRNSEFEWMIERSARLHLEHIATSGDPFEKGSARPLDFGHWSAHKLEMLSEHRLSHGEAVCLGIILDARYSLEMGYLRKQEFVRIYDLCKNLGLPVYDPLLSKVDGQGRSEIMKGLEEFRIHLGGELTLIQLRGIGNPLEVHTVDPFAMTRSLEWMKEQSQNDGALEVKRFEA